MIFYIYMEVDNIDVFIINRLIVRKYLKYHSLISRMSKTPSPWLTVPGIVIGGLKLSWRCSVFSYFMDLQCVSIHFVVKTRHAWICNQVKLWSGIIIIMLKRETQNTLFIAAYCPGATYLRSANGLVLKNNRAALNSIARVARYGFYP